MILKKLQWKIPPACILYWNSPIYLCNLFIEWPFCLWKLPWWILPYFYECFSKILYIEELFRHFLRIYFFQGVHLNNFPKSHHSLIEICRYFQMFLILANAPKTVFLRTLIFLRIVLQTFSRELSENVSVKNFWRIPRQISYKNSWSKLMWVFLGNFRSSRSSRKVFSSQKY